MKKTEALELLGGTPSSAAAAIGITVSAVSQWPDELPATISDRVEAALWRMSRQAAAAAPAPRGAENVEP